MESRSQTTASPFRSAMHIAIAALVVAGVAGCKQFIMLSYLIGGPPSIEPDFDAQTGRQLTEYGVKVAVVCYAKDQLKWDFDSIDYQIALAVSQQLRNQEIQVVDPDRVRAWLRDNPDWDRPQEIGAGLVDADGLKPTHVIQIDLLDYNLYELNSNNLFRGRAEATVSVFKMDEDGSGDGQKVYSNEIKSQYPIHTAISTSEVSYGTFKQQYLFRLSDEIGRLFYPHYAGDDIPNGA